MNGRLEFIFGLSSLIGLVITGIVTIFAVLEGSYETQANVLIFSLAAINIALAVVCVILVMRTESISQETAILQPTIRIQEEKISLLNENIERIVSDHSEVADILHSIQDQLRDRIFELTDTYAGIVSSDLPTKTELIDLERTNEMFYLFVVNNIKTLLDILTGDKCAVCIKILDIGESPKDIIMVRTFMRDSSSYRERKSSDKSIYEYPYYENTAFKNILSKSPESYYASDNLTSESTYVNANDKWTKFYNSTLVCPIRMELIEEIETVWNDYSVLGFVCADNLKGGLNNRSCIQLLASISDSLYNHFLMFNSVRGTITDAPTEQLAT